MGQDPREAWRKLQQTLANAQQQGKRGIGGSPKGALGGIAGLLLLGGGVIVFNNALFNGRDSCLFRAGKTTYTVFS